MGIPKDFTEGIVLKKNGLYRYQWNNGQKKTKIDSLIKWLCEPLFIDKGVTFGDFFNLIMNEHEKASDIFTSHLGGYSLSDWLVEWNQSGERVSNDQEKIEYVELKWVVEYHSNHPDWSIDEGIEMIGKGRKKNSDLFGDDNWNDTNFGFSFTSINELKNYPIRLNNDWKIFDWDAVVDTNLPADERDVNSFGFNNSKQMTVYDVVGAILFDISFYGPPNTRNKTLGELQDTVDYVKEHPEELIEFDDKRLEITTDKK